MAAGATIYALCDPVTRRVRYVGKTKSLDKRIRSHRCEAKDKRFQTRKANWLRSIGADPIVEVLAEVDAANWETAERYWIAEMRRRGCDLVNYADGGQTSPVEGKGHSEESKAKMRAAALRNGSKPPSRRGTVSSDATREKLRIAVRKRGCRPPNRGGWNKGVRKDRCRNGHEYLPETTRIYHRRDRDVTFQICRICERQSQLRYEQKKGR